jgi:hypothetical protein
MSHQRSVGLVQSCADPFAPGIVRLFDIERDHTLAVARYYNIAWRGGSDEIESQSVLRILVYPRSNRQAERDERRDNTPLGDLNSAPQFPVSFYGQIGNGTVQATGNTKGFVRSLSVCPHQPVTSCRGVQIGAASVSARVRIPGTNEMPGFCLRAWFEREDFSLGRFITEFRCTA